MKEETCSVNRPTTFRLHQPSNTGLIVSATAVRVACEMIIESRMLQSHSSPLLRVPQYDPTIARLAAGCVGRLEPSASD